MSKARTYNMDANGEQRQELDPNASQLYTKNEFITFQSSRYQESEVFSDPDEAPSEAINVSSYVMNIQSHQSECDFLEVDEFEKMLTLPDSVIVNKPEVFGDM